MIRLELSTTLAFILYFIVLLYSCEASLSYVTNTISESTPPILDLIQTAIKVESTGTDARDIPREYVFSTTFEKVPLSLQMKLAPADLDGLPSVLGDNIAPEVLSAYGKRVNIPETYNNIETLKADIYNCFKEDGSEAKPTDLLIKRTPVIYRDSGEGRIKEFFYQTYRKQTEGTEVFYKRISANDNLVILPPVESV